MKHRNRRCANAGCCLLSLFYLPFGVVFELTKKYNKPRRR